jgi:hypothetical protein
MRRVWLGAVYCLVVFGSVSAAQNGQVQVNDGRWVVIVRVDQDRSGRAESGFAPRIATTIASRKILEFGCKLKPGVGERVSGQVKGLVTLGISETNEWAEVVVAAPLQPLKCKLEKLAAATDVDVNEQGSPVSTLEPTVFREVKTDY